MPEAILWSPENPFLYVLETGTGGDSCTTRFGMREFHFDTASKRAWLNGKVIYLRGSSDHAAPLLRRSERAAASPGTRPGCGSCWRNPARMHWNAFRLCIGPPPEQWLDIADESRDCCCSTRFPSRIWNQARYLKHWKEAEVIGQFKEFVRDNWNHPSVVLGTPRTKPFGRVLRTKVIPAVRGLDLSNRPWECGYNGPQGPDDPYEDHPYFLLGRKKPPLFPLVAMETGSGWQKPIGTPMNSHACIINEYDALFVRRDGRPTLASRKEFDYLLGPRATCEQRFELSAYCPGRTDRVLAGVSELCGRDVPRLPGRRHRAPNRDLRQFPGHRAARARSLFCRLRGRTPSSRWSVRHFWQPELPAARKRSYRVMMVNDTHEQARGRLDLVWQIRERAAAGGASPAGVRHSRSRASDLRGRVDDAGRGGTVPAQSSGLLGRQVWSPTVARRKVAVK